MKEAMKASSVSRVFRFPNREAYEKAKNLLTEIAAERLPIDAIAQWAEADEDRGNIALKVGIENLWRCAIGHPSAKPWTSSTARLGVGDGQTPASPDQTGLQGANKAYAPMDPGYPMLVGQTGLVFQATFPENSAQFAWHEWCITNTDGVPLNRKVQYRGTKGPNAVWVLQVRVDIS